MSQTIVEFDGRSRAVVPGHPNEKFLVRDNPDGSILLEPAIVKSKAQEEYDNDPKLRELLDRAWASPRVERPRLGRRRTRATA